MNNEIVEISINKVKRTYQLWVAVAGEVQRNPVPAPPRTWEIQLSPSWCSLCLVLCAVQSVTGICDLLPLAQGYLFVHVRCLFTYFKNTIDIYVLSELHNILFHYVCLLDVVLVWQYFLSTKRMLKNQLLTMVWKICTTCANTNINL